MGCLSYCRKGPASPQFAQSAQWCKQRYCIDLIYPILLLAIQPFALFAVVLPAMSSRWCIAAAPHGLPVFIGGPLRSNFAALLRHQSLPDGASQRRLTVCQSSSAVLPEVTSQRRPCQLCIPDGSLPQCRWPAASAGCPYQQLRHGAPASNKPHPAEKSTPVWLAIWRIWAGFANSQHRDAALATPDNICAHSSLLPH